MSKVASSAYYAQQKAEYKKKIEAFKAIKEKVSGLNSYVTTCTESTKVYVDQIIILGESMDKGSLSTAVQGNLDKVSQNIETIIEECDKLIGKYQDLYDEAERNYQQALAEEEAARKAAENKKKNPLSFIKI